MRKQGNFFLNHFRRTVAHITKRGNDEDVDDGWLTSQQRSALITILQ